MKKDGYTISSSPSQILPNFPRSFMLSLSFATHILGLRGAAEVCASKRIDGAMKIHCERRSKVRQRSALTAEQVKSLEKVVNRIFFAPSAARHQAQSRNKQKH